jgi:hypothetical protein
MTEHTQTIVPGSQLIEGFCFARNEPPNELLDGHGDQILAVGFKLAPSQPEPGDPHSGVPKQGVGFLPRSGTAVFLGTPKLCGIDGHSV